MCRKLSFLIFVVLVLAVVGRASALPLKGDAGTYILQPGWSWVFKGVNTDVGGTGIDVKLATGEPNAIAARSAGGSGELLYVERDFYFANGEVNSPGADFILTLSNLTPGAAYRLLSYHNRSGQPTTVIPSVTVTGATKVIVPDFIVQDHNIMENPAEILFEATDANVVIRYQGPDGNRLGCQAFFNGFILDYLDYPEVKAREPSPPNEAENVCPDVVLSWKPGFYAAQQDVYLGTDFNDVNDANTVTTLGVYMQRQPINDTNFAPGDFLQWDTTFYWRIDNVNDPNTGRGDVWSFRTTEASTAREPTPYNGAERVDPCTVLSWTPICLAASHDVYLGTDFAAVNDANTTVTLGVYMGNQDSNIYDPCAPLEWLTTYYWRVDGVTDTNERLKGGVWSFSVDDFFLVVDDMESYCSGFGCDNWIYDTWLDGFAWPNYSGSEVSLGIKPFEPVHGGKQSMVYVYDNGDSELYGLLYYSEAEREFDTPQDWTEAGVKILTLFFHGDADNDADATEQMYAGVEDSTGAGSYAQVDYGFYGEDMNDIKKEEWQEWDIALRDFIGVDANFVQKVYIGFGIRGNPNPGGTPGGIGTVYFDDIRLYVRRCVPEFASAADFTDDCLVNLRDFAILGGQWLRPPGTPSADISPEPPDGVVDWLDLGVLSDSWLEQILWPE